MVITFPLPGKSQQLRGMQMDTTAEIKLSDYQYDLPEDRIAKFPLEKRDQSKLLHYENGKIAHHRFYELPTLLPSNTQIGRAHV